MTFLVILLLSFIQNVAFAIVSRARNRDNTTYHTLASILSNGIWFMTFRVMVLADMNMWLFLPFTAGSVAGGVCGAKWSMVIERRIGALADGHIVTAKLASQRAKATKV